MSNLDYILDNPQLVDFSRLDKAVLDKIHDICSYASHSLPAKFEALMGYYMAWKQGIGACVENGGLVVLRPFSLKVIEAIRDNSLTKQELYEFLGLEEAKIRSALARLVRSEQIRCDEDGIYIVTPLGHRFIQKSYPENWSKYLVKEAYKANKTIAKTHKVLRVHHDFLINLMDYHGISYKSLNYMAQAKKHEIVKEYPIYKKAGALDILAEKHGRTKKCLYAIYKRGTE